MNGLVCTRAFVARQALILHRIDTMTLRHSYLLRTLCALALLVAASGARADSDWEVIKVGRWDYLTVDNIAKFYGFPGDASPVEKVIRLNNGRNHLEVALGSREAIVNGVRNWLCFPVIQHTDGRYLISRIDLAKTLEPQFRPHLIPTLGKLKTVVIDPGHGGIEKGAASTYGLEKDFSIDVARHLKTMVEAKGLRVVMTRTGDEQVPLPQRARIANATRESIFVSIHFNATDSNANAAGFEIYSLTPRGAPSTQDNALQARFADMQAGSPVDAASLILSTSVYHAMLGYMPEFDRGVKRARFAVLRLTQVPAILVEGGFLSERHESRLIANPEWRRRLAQAISVGIDNYRALVEKKQRPMLLADYRRQFEGVLVARDASAPTPAVSQIRPAANIGERAGALAQLTNALRNEPSPQITISENHNDDEHATSNTPPATITPPEVAANQPDVAANQPPAAPAADADVTMPGASEQPSAPPEVAATETVATPPAPVEQPQVVSAPAAATPTPAQVRKYWVLKFEPPPKFRP
jgi:N-acetylmuramoyl-L-alanine amidase